METKHDDIDIKKILAPLTEEQLKSLSKQDLVDLLIGEQSLRFQFEKWAQKATEEKLEVEGKYLLIKKRMFSPSSEKTSKILKKNITNAELTDNPSKADSSKKDDQSKGDKNKRKEKNKRVLLPSERYPNAPIERQDITLENPPSCPCCFSKMKETGMTEVREKLTVIPKKYIVVQQHYHIYGCSCHGHLATPPTIPQITPGAVYSDDMTIDIGISKYCDLIPIERYVTMAARQGFEGLPANSLIDQTHQLAFYLSGIYQLIKREVQGDWLTYADETPHKMLEGSKRKNWFLWQFSNSIACYFECHDTRSGDIASNFLIDSNIKYLMSDVYAGYNKAIRECNKKRAEVGRKLLIALYCNSHSRRKFGMPMENFIKYCYQPMMRWVSWSIN